MTRTIPHTLLGGLATVLLLAMALSCSSDDKEKEGDFGVSGDGAVSSDAGTIADAPSNGANDGFVHTDSSWDGSVPVDVDPSCAEWSGWYCEGEYPNYKAVCPPGLDPELTIVCVPSGMCTCEVTGVPGERQCGYTPDPVGGSVCSSMEQIFNKGCCRP